MVESAEGVRNPDLDFAETGAKVNDLLNELEEEGFDEHATLSGAITAVLTRLIVRNPDNTMMLAELAHAIKKATILVDLMDSGEGPLH
jgi:hypothetical protein